MSPAGVLVTFQVTFTELFIAATVILAVVHRYGWRSAAIGSVIGAVSISAVSLVLAHLGARLPVRLLDWVSSLLLIGFGLFLLYEVWTSRQDGGEPPGMRVEADGAASLSLNWSGVGLAAWGVFIEGVEIMVVWLAIALKQGMATASAGLGIGVAVIATVAVTLGRIGIFRRIPAHRLDLIAGVMVLLYGFYFMAEALSASGAAPI